ncbi:hypothetical protein ACFQ8C_20825 [Streptomyces sp. NPDC056503]|uniref:hypothetical protein n=1 Tax=Streptomyces sp. NPDC056503 TaxID=3345842 RepID=UPI0036AB99AE
MLQIDKAQMIAGVQIYGDHENPALFYAVPQQPTFRCDAEGNPVFMYLKYKNAKVNPSGSNGGGFAAFDTQFALDDATRAVILDQLRAQVGAGLADRVGLGTITWANGTAHLNLSEVSGTLVSKVWNPVGPSLYGDNVTPFTLELPQEGATLFAEALQGKGGIVQVAYGMNGWVKLPAITGYGHFSSTKFRSFVQDASDDAGWGDDTFSNKIAEVAVNTDVIETHVDAGTGADAQMVARVEESIRRTVLDIATKRMTEQIEGYTGDRSVLEDYETIHREYSNLRVDDFTMTVNQQTAVLWPFNPQGTLPNITNMVDKKGSPVLWADHYREIDLDDPFFRSFSVPVRVNADFGANRPVHSVDVHVQYQGDKLESADYHFDKPEQTDTFAAYVKGDSKEFQHSFTVNYKGTSTVYQSPLAPHTGPLTINADDLGVLELHVLPGNLDFTSVESATVTIEYTPSNGQAITDQVVFTAQNSTERVLTHVIGEKRDRPVRYRVDYRTKSDAFQDDWKETTGKRIYLSSPFNDMRRLRIVAVGDLASTIDSILVDVRYEDPQNGYSWAADSKELKAAEPYGEWTVQVRDATSGTLTYGGLVRYKNGSVRDIPETVTEEATVEVGDVIGTVISVVLAPDLVDWATVELVKVVLTCNGGAPAQEQVKSALVRKEGTTPPVVFSLPDAATKEFSWTATYFFTDGTSAGTAPVTTADTNLLLPRRPAA